MPYFKLQYLTTIWGSTRVKVKSWVIDRIFYGRNVSAFKRLNGYRTDFCPEELQWGKKLIIWFSKERQKKISLLSSLLPPSVPLLQWNMQKQKMCTQAGWNVYGLTSLFLDNWLQNVKFLLTSVFVSALSDHKHPNQVDSWKFTRHEQITSTA